MGLSLAIPTIVVSSVIGASNSLNPDETISMTIDEASWLGTVHYSSICCCESISISRLSACKNFDSNMDKIVYLHFSKHHVHHTTIWQCNFGFSEWMAWPATNHNSTECLPVDRMGAAGVRKFKGNGVYRIWNSWVWRWLGHCSVCLHWRDLVSVELSFFFLFQTSF